MLNSSCRPVEFKGMPRRCHLDPLSYAWVALLTGLLLGALGGCAPLAKAEPCIAAAVCRDALQLRTGGQVRYFRSLPLERNERVRRVVVVVHGNARDPDRYFERLVAAATLEERLDDTLLLAPGFRTAKDGPLPGEHYWSSSGWKIGNKSKDDSRISSFAVVDELLARVCPSSEGPFPNLEVVAIAGHSAGGQFVNRYAGGGRGCPDSGVALRFLVMNPSSYLYLDARRPAVGSDEFRIPSSPGCDDFDDYKYGLQDLNSYMKGVGRARIRANLFARQTLYLAGAKDTRAGGSLDTSCRGGWQGANRLERFVNYRRYSRLFPDWKESRFEVVPAVGHSGGRMFRSEAARGFLFR